MSASRQYELVYLITPDASEQEVADLHTQIEQIVSRFGASNTVLDKTENWGRRKLAYEIGHHREATYVVETISSTPKSSDSPMSSGKSCHCVGSTTSQMPDPTAIASRHRLITFWLR